MNRDKGIYNLSHMYDPVIRKKVNIKKTSGTGSGEHFSHLSSAGSSQQQLYSPDEAGLLLQFAKLSTKM